MMEMVKVIKGYQQKVCGIPVFYIKVEGCDETFMTFSKKDYDQIMKKRKIEACRLF